jgi:hypothetical protein
MGKSGARFSNGTQEPFGVILTPGRGGSSRPPASMVRDVEWFAGEVKRGGHHVNADIFVGGHNVGVELDAVAFKRQIGGRCCQPIKRLWERHAILVAKVFRQKADAELLARRKGVRELVKTPTEPVCGFRFHRCNHFVARHAASSSSVLTFTFRPDGRRMDVS